MLGMGRIADEPEERDAPGVVVWAVAAATASLPILAVYAITFIVHGGVHPVAPPDITDSARGELYAGLFALALLLVSIVAMLWMLSGRRRWPFVIVQLGMLATAIDFFVDATKGGRVVSLVVGVASLVALVCAFTRPAWAYLNQRPPVLRRRPPAALDHEANPDPDAAAVPAADPGDR